MAVFYIGARLYVIMVDTIVYITLLFIVWPILTILGLFAKKAVHGVD
jgi:hypothetical protein